MLRNASCLAAAVACLPGPAAARVVHYDGFEGGPCEVADADGDRLSGCAERGLKLDPAVADTDGDGHEDGEEVLGTLGGLDLPALGVDPRRRDVLMEYDWFDDALHSPGSGHCAGPSHSHRPTAAALQIVTDAFAAAPLPNPDGSTGVTVIHDYGQGGAFSGGNLVPDADGVIQGSASGADYFLIYDAHFAPARRGYFHYVVLPHQYLTASGQWSSGSGQVYPGARRDRIIVSLYCAATDRRVGNTIVHELGHNGGLLHGGDDDCNHKPNYNSVMNYRFQFVGPDTTCDALADAGADYSRGQRIALDEAALDESAGVCGSAAVDWNASLGIDPAPLVFNLNKQDKEIERCGGELTVLRDHDDWSAFEFDIDAWADGGGKPMPPAAECEAAP